jgi:ABC-type multidrug transport system ATPase subunit/pSer/pThr/pTyr-binding forkhead associated (FHA) protein
MADNCPFCDTPLADPSAATCPSCGRPLSPAAGATVALQSQPVRVTVQLPGRDPAQVALEKDIVTLGRHPENDIVLPLDPVSRFHGRFERRGDVWAYLDLDSTNGTLVNGKLVKSTLLHDGDLLRIGDPKGVSVALTFHAASATGEMVPFDGSIRLGATALDAGDSLVIGRHPEANIVLPSPIVSRRHARLDRTAQGHLLTDLGSTNGTFVNGQRVDQPRVLAEGDVVQIGPFRLIYQAERLEQQAITGGVRLDAIRLARDVGGGRHRKRILHDINLSVYPREFVALVGTSGAGKTTLLTALNGSHRPEGHVLVNGENLYRHFDRYRTLVGYVPQDDIVHKEIKVASVLRYAARLRLPPDTTRKEIEERIDRVLEQVDMVAQKNQVVNSLSGGQRKRVSIAVELLADPNLFFLDEPTSGLDPGLEKKMMLTLRRIADSGRTVVLVTHATANITQCDLVCFLAHGRLVYYGPPQEAFEFFGVSGQDFADIYALLDDPDPQRAIEKATEWEERFRQAPQYVRYVVNRLHELPRVREETGRAAPARRPRVNPVRQFAVLTRRYLDLVLHDRLLLIILFAVMPVIGLLVLMNADESLLVGHSEAYIVQDIEAQLAEGKRVATYSIVGGAQGLLYPMVMAAVLLGLFAAAYEIVRERSIFRRERMVMLQLVPYVASKIVVLSVFALVQCVLFLFAVGLKVIFPVDGVLMPALVEMWVTLVLAAIASMQVGLLISAVVPRPNPVVYIVLVALMYQTVFSGVRYDLEGPGVFLSNFAVTRWAAEAMGATIDIESLNELTRSRFQPDPITREFSVDIPRPADDWEPVTVVTTTRTIAVPCMPGFTTDVPIPVPDITVNELVTVTEAVTQSVTIEPEAVDLSPTMDLPIDYSRTPEHMIASWLSLSGIGLASALATLVLLKRKDTA